MRKSVNLARLRKRIRKIRQGETAWHRACKDTGDFRKESNWWFWGPEVVGSAVFGVAGGLIGYLLAGADTSQFWQNAYPTIGGSVGIVVGFVIVYCGIFVFSLVKAPYKQRDDARQELRELKRTQQESSQPASRKDISLVYDSFFSGCVGHFKDGVQVYRIGVLNSSNETVTAGVVVSGSYNLNPELSTLPLRPTYGASGSSGKLEVDPSSEFHLGSVVDFVRWNPKDKTIQICYLNNPYPEESYVYKLVRGRKYSIWLQVVAKDARVETEWQAKISVDKSKLDIDLSEVEVLEF